MRIYISYAQLNKYIMTERSLRSTRQNAQCRICLEQGDSSNFSSPCQCRGSIQFVHLTCLKEYFEHRFKNSTAAQRRRMREAICCQICKTEINSLKIQASKRCATCEELDTKMEAEDVFFIIVFMLLYVGFHAIGILLIIQESIASKIIGAFWLLLTIICFNYGLYKIMKELCYVYQAEVKHVRI